MLIAEVSELSISSETSAISIVMPGNYPKENILHTEHGESLISRTLTLASVTSHNIIKFCNGISYCIMK